MVGRFLGGIGALIFNPEDDTYLLLKRSSQKDFGAGNWECITGRVDQGEGFEEALYREVREEIGLDVRVEFIIGTSHFYRGPAMPENELIGVIYACSTTTPEAVQLSAEHAECRWLSADEALALLDTTRASESWLHNVIRRAELIRQHLPSELQEIYRTEGFSIG